MHNLALALHHQGHTVTGSDDAIHDPSRSRLEAAGLLRTPWGGPDRLHTGLDKVILGIHTHPTIPNSPAPRSWGWTWSVTRNTLEPPGTSSASWWGAVTARPPSRPCCCT